MRLTQFTDYALRTLMYLEVYSDRKCTVKEISNIYNISYNHMVKVVHSLSRCGYIQSFKGKGGGIILLDAVRRMTLREIIETLEPDLDLVECFSQNGQCCITPVCRLKNILAEAHNAFMQELDKYKLADIASNQKELLSIFEYDKPV